MKEEIQINQILHQVSWKVDDVILQNSEQRQDK